MDRGVSESIHVRVQGVVTDAPLRLHERGQFLMQNAGAGIQVDDPELRGLINQTLEAGMRVEVVGEIGELAGALNLIPVGPIRVVGSDEVPAPRRVHVSNFSRDLVGVVVDPGRVEIVAPGEMNVRSRGFPVQAVDDEGSEFNIRVETACGVRCRVLAPGETVDVQGVLNSFDDIWTILPRSPADLQ